MSRVVAVGEHGDHLDGRELESTVGILMVAGHGATASLLGNSFLAPQRHPEAKDRLRTEPAIAENAGQELLLYDAPVQVTERFPTTGLNIASHKLTKDQLIGLFFGATNRDPERYDRPDEHIPDRRGPRQLPFGNAFTIVWVPRSL